LQEFSAAVACTILVMPHFAFSLAEPEWSFLAAFFEGEASLAITELNGGQSYSCGVTLCQRDDEQELLEWCHAVTGLGSLYRVRARATSRPQIGWMIESRDDCVELLRIIDGCGFHGRRRGELLVWREAVHEWVHGEGHARRLAMRALKSKLAAARRFGAGPPTAVPFASRRQQLGYISGFVCAEGSFSLSGGRPTFAIHLRQDDRPLLELLAGMTGLGAVYDHRPYPPLAPNPSSTWNVTAHQQLARLSSTCSPKRASPDARGASWRSGRSRSTNSALHDVLACGHAGNWSMSRRLNSGALGSIAHRRALIYSISPAAMCAPKLSMHSAPGLRRRAARCHAPATRDGGNAA
jgi:hypothetical protein